MTVKDAVRQQLEKFRLWQELENLRLPSDAAGISHAEAVRYADWLYLGSKHFGNQYPNMKELTKMYNDKMEKMKNNIREYESSNEKRFAQIKQTEEQCRQNGQDLTQKIEELSQLMESINQLLPEMERLMKQANEGIRFVDKLRAVYDKICKAIRRLLWETTDLESHRTTGKPCDLPEEAEYDPYAETDGEDADAPVNARMFCNDTVDDNNAGDVPKQYEPKMDAPPKSMKSIITSGEKCTADNRHGLDGRNTQPDEGMSSRRNMRK